MTILLATNGKLDRGGITIFMLQWVRGIKQAITESKVIVYYRESIESEEIAAEYKALGATVFISNIPKGTSFKNRKANDKVRNDIRLIIKKEKPDVLHINSRMFGFNVLLLTEAKRYGIPVRIAHAHGAISEKAHDKVIHYFMKKRIRSLATVYAGCSKIAGYYLFGEKGIYSSKWQFVPNTIQTERFSFDEIERKRRRKILGVKDEELLLGAVGHLTEVKNHVFLIDLVYSLRSKDLDVKLLIIGEGDRREELQEKCKEYGIKDQVIIYGPSDEVPGWLSAMDYYVMPSLSEGFPISAVEAQANGLVCLLSDKITREVDLTDSVYHLSIDHGLARWMNVIDEHGPNNFQERKISVRKIKQAGFDDKNTSIYVKKLYGI